MLALAPQLDTFRIRNGSTGVPLQLLQEICTLGTVLRVLDTSVVQFDTSAPSFLRPSHLAPSDAPAINLCLFIEKYRPNFRLGGPVREQLWGVIEGCTGGGLKGFSEMRALGQLALPVKLEEEYSVGLGYAMAQARVMGCELRFEEPEMFPV